MDAPSERRTRVGTNPHPRLETELGWSLVQLRGMVRPCNLKDDAVPNAVADVHVMNLVMEGSHLVFQLWLVLNRVFQKNIEAHDENVQRKRKKDEV